MIVKMSAVLPGAADILLTNSFNRNASAPYNFNPVLKLSFQQSYEIIIPAFCLGTFQKDSIPIIVRDRCWKTISHCFQAARCQHLIILTNNKKLCCSQLILTYICSNNHIFAHSIYGMNDHFFLLP